MDDPWALLAAGAAAVGVRLEPEFEPRARRFLAELRRWNRVRRLTGYRTEVEQVIHLVLESLLLLPVLPSPAAPLLDIGSGAGAPGLVLKLARPAWPVTLVEANRRRAHFLRHAVRHLQLEGAEVQAMRAEALAQAPAFAGVFRTVTMRAVAAPDTAVRLARPFLAPEGHIVSVLGPGRAPSFGTVREVAAVLESRRLHLRRRFLIIRASEVAADVPRGTRGVRGPSPQCS